MFDLKNWMDSWPLPKGEPITGKTYLADGWVYRDLPKLTYEAFDKFVAIVGEDNLVWLTEADYGNSKRGQLLISPAGLARIADHHEQSTKDAN